jgi:hypothetical protein
LGDVRYALDDAYAAALIEAERDFWQHVQDGTPPAPLPAPKRRSRLA